MIAASLPGERNAKLLAVGADGAMRVLARSALASSFAPGDLVVANDAATLPASLFGIHCASGRPIEARLAAWVSPRDPTRFDAIAFGAGDHRVRTEDRAPPPPLAAGDRLVLGALEAVIEGLPHPPRLFRLRFLGDRATILSGLARSGRPVQYAHVAEHLSLNDVWTAVAADPIAFEPPSAGFALDWRTLSIWRRRCVRFATISLAAGLSSTGSPELDARLPLDEPFRVPEDTAQAIADTKRKGGRIVAIGTTVVRALEAAADADDLPRAGDGVARGRIGRGAKLVVVDSVLTGVHEPHESHFELLRAFADDSTLKRMSETLKNCRFRGHEFGDSVLVERLSLAGRRAPIRLGGTQTSVPQLVVRPH